MKNFKRIIMIVIIVGVVISVYYYIGEDKKINNEEVKTVLNQEEIKNNEVGANNEEGNEVKESVKEKDGYKDEDIYNTVIKDYKLAMNEYNPDSLTSIESKYSLVNENLISHVYTYSNNNIELGYTYYDIDNNGRNELIVGVTSENDNSLLPAAIYTYNENKEIKKIYFLDTIERGKISIYENGTIYSSGAGSASIHYYRFYKLSDDGNSKETLEEIREEYKTENDVVYYNNENDKILNYKNSNEIIKKYINGAKEITFSIVEKFK